MSFYGGRPGKPFQIAKVFNHFGELYEEAYSTTVSGYFDSVAPGCFALINYGILESKTYYDNIAKEDAWFEAHNLPKDYGLRDYMATVWNETSYRGSYDYNSSIWVKVYNPNFDSAHPFRYHYIGNISAIYPEIINDEWHIAGRPTGVIAGSSDATSGKKYAEEAKKYLDEVKKIADGLANQFDFIERFW